MPNYSLVINSSFKPFTYDELYAPVKRMSDVHDQIAAQYDELSAKADILEAMGEKDKNSKAYAQYKAFSDQLRQEADNLMQYGLNGGAKSRILGLKSAYNKDIVPIQNAWNKRDEEAQAQQKALLANNTLMFTRTAANTSIDDYLANPTGGYGIIDGSLISKQMGEMAAQLADQVSAGRVSIDNLDPYTQRIIQGHGMTAAEINQWIKDPDSFPTLKNMMLEVLRANGATPEALGGSANANQIIRNSISYAQMGAWKALGKDEVSTQKDVAAAAALEDYYKQKEETRKAEAERQKAFQGGQNDIPAFTVNYSEIPMYGADNSNAGKQRDALKVLGYKEIVGKDDLEFNGKITLKYDLTKDELNAENQTLWDDVHRLQAKKDSGTITPEEDAELMTKYFKASRGYHRAGTSKEYSIYDDKGRIMTRDKFVAQAGNSKNAKKALNDYYDKILKAEEDLGVSGASYTHDELDAYYNRLRNSQAAQFIYGTDLGIEPGSWSSGSQTTLRAKVVKGYEGGRPKYENKDISLQEILKNSEKAAAYWIRDKNQEGIIITTVEDGEPRRYFIPRDRIGNDMVQAGADFMTEADNIYDKKSKRYQDARMSGVQNIVAGLTGRYGEVSRDIEKEYSVKDKFPIK